ncbi:hypothetical protein COV82_06425 [Candidatus Peregrinibacteria bacterium CG11_big_fil_rev_8_21_14_0_20_46_8]|nr:MAG: hypothetical protein COV82_06425 [Candidatus Peregrinibacteria bacterium CG11_big_fil_rev_8_21_14_0_20_46_8]
MKPVQTTFLYIAISLCFIFLAIVVSPFLTTLILAAILVTSTYPIYESILRGVKNRKTIASLIMSVSIGILFSFFVFLFFVLIADEAISTYQHFEQWISNSSFNLNVIIAYLNRYLDLPNIDLTASLTQAAQALSTRLVTSSTNFLKSIAWFLANFFLLVFTMFFFYKDGKLIVLFIEKLIPLTKRNSREILYQFRKVSLGMMYGIFLTAIIQGILGGFGLAVAGIRNPIFWGTVMGFFGMLPIGGTMIVWLPASIILLANDQYVAGIGLLIWGGGIVAFVDNLIKPLVIAKQAQIYPLATFFVVIGGLLVFGIRGAVIAPMVLAAFVTLAHIQEREGISAEY